MLHFKELHFNSQSELNNLLYQHQIDPTKWIKTPQNLFKEVQERDCILGLEDGQLHRKVQVAHIKCFYTNNHGEKLQLKEDRQVFKNGNVRERGFQFVAEKIQFGEPPKDAALRGLSEELQIFGPDIDVVPLEEENIFERRASSNTYVGIASSYQVYVFKCDIPHNHYRDSYVEVQEEKQTFFSWMKI